MVVRIGWLLLLALGGVGVGAGAASLSSGGQFQLRNATIDGGGGLSQGGEYILNGTIGQPDAGGPLQGGSYSLRGGFWTPSEPITRVDLVFLDGFE